jgi:PAS domain S-box-containing protein
MQTTGRYAVAIIATAVALVLTAAMPELLAPMRLFFLWCAVLFTAVVAGLGPALVTVALSVFGSMYLIFAPIGSLAVHGPVDILRLVMFATFAAGISVVAARRRSAEERARISEMRYRTLIEATPLPQAVWSASAEGQIAWADTWIGITGLSREELERGAGMSVIHPDDASRTWQRWSESIAKKTPYEDEIRVRVASGRYRWFAIRAVPLQLTSKRHEWAGIVADIHERKRYAENTTFINQASDVLSSSLGFDETLRNLSRLCVPGIADSCAIDIGSDEMYERMVVEHADPTRVELLDDLRRMHPENVADALKAGTTQLTETTMIVPMRARGRSLGALSLACDESGRRFSEEDVPLIEELARRAAMALDNARLYEAAESANRAKDEFLATLSHELRTPLTAIAGWAHMLGTGMTDEQTSKVAIDTIVRSAKAQGELIDDLLDLSRVVAGTLHLEVITVDLGQIVEEVVVAARPAIDAKELELEVAASQRVLLVRGDDRRLRQIVWNLVSNAVKFTDAGGRVRIRLQAAGNSARVEVSDTGRGIDAAFLPYVWERFRQADSSTSRQHGGLGLGLAVVRHLVELHGGTVAVASEGIGRGSTFTVELPLARLEGQDAAPRRARTDAGLLRGRTMLVVDDDDDARLVLATMLRQHGAVVSMAASADEAMEAMATQTFDVVVSDIAMPHEDGFSLARRIRATSNVPLVAVSAIASGPEDRLRALDAGFVEFVRKPVDPGQLALAVAAALR